MTCRFLAAPTKGAERRLANVRGIGDIWVSWTDLDTTEPHGIGLANLPPPTTVPVLISAIQKASRRFEPTVACRAALTILHLSPDKLWRRLPVIMVEDAEITGDLVFLVWCTLMSAVARRRGGDGWKAPRVVVDKMLGVVRDMCRPDTRNDWHEMVWVNLQHVLPPLHRVLSGMDSNGLAYHVAWACYVRRAYGGMPQDLKMLETTARGAEQFPFVDRPLAAPLPHDQLTPVTDPTDVPWCAADFHCFPWMLRKFDGKTEADVRHVMWTESSGVNYRRANHRAPQDYRLLADHQPLAQWALQKVFSKP